MTIPIPMRLVRYVVTVSSPNVWPDDEGLVENAEYTEPGEPLVLLVRRYDRERFEKLLERSPMVRSYRAKEVQS